MNLASVRRAVGVRRLALAVLACWSSIAPARAHDFWILPSTFNPEAGARISVELQVGEHWNGESVARNPERIERFFAVHGDGREETVAGIDGKSPAGLVRATQAELLAIGYVSRPASVELAAEKFEAYLAEEGLEHVIELRKQRGDGQKAGREIYSRSVKSLIRVGAPGSSATGSSATAIAGTDFDRRLGLPLELFLERDPRALRPGDELSVRLEFREKPEIPGTPLAGALVGAARRGDAEHEMHSRTDREGRVKLKLDAGGVWLVHVVHMIPAAAGEGVDWRSYWASLTFELSAR